MQPQTARVLNHWQDSPDVLPGTPLTHKCKIRREHSHIPAAPVEVGWTTPSHELARMREHPELFFEWQLDIAFAAREAELQKLGVCEWDCGTCGHWVITLTPLDPCPQCGAE